MTEQEYIDVSNITRYRDADKMLREALPTNKAEQKLRAGILKRLDMLMTKTHKRIEDSIHE